MHLLDARVHQRLAFSALHNKLLIALELCSRQKDVLGKGEDTVALDDLGEGLGLADLLSDDIWGVEKVDFAVYNFQPLATNPRGMKSSPY